MEGLPALLPRLQALLIQLPEPVVAIRAAEEQGVAAPLQQHGAQDLRPDLIIHEGGLVQHREVEAFAAEIVCDMRAADGEQAAAGQVDATRCFADLRLCQRRQRMLQIAPDLVGHFQGGRQPPAAPAHQRAADDGHLAQLGLAEAAPAGDDAKTRLTRQNSFLPRMGFYESNRSDRGIRHVQALPPAAATAPTP